MLNSAQLVLLETTSLAPDSVQLGITGIRNIVVERGVPFFALDTPVDGIRLAEDLRPTNTQLEDHSSNHPDLTFLSTKRPSEVRDVTLLDNPGVYASLHTIALVAATQIGHTLLDEMTKLPPEESTAIKNVHTAIQHILNSVHQKTYMRNIGLHFHNRISKMRLQKLPLEYTTLLGFALMRRESAFEERR